MQIQRDIRPTSGGVVTLKTGTREVLGSNPGRACRPSRSEFSVVFSETRIKKVLLEGIPLLGPAPSCMLLDSYSNTIIMLLFFYEKHVSILRETIIIFRSLLEETGRSNNSFTSIILFSTYTFLRVEMGGSRLCKVFCMSL